MSGDGKDPLTCFDVSLATLVLFRPLFPLYEADVAFARA